VAKAARRKSRQDVKRIMKNGNEAWKDIGDELEAEDGPSNPSDLPEFPGPGGLEEIHGRADDLAR